MTIKVLVAEDDPIFRELICDIVTQQGYEPVEAKDGKEAMDLFFSEDTPDLLILDVMMPFYDGWQVLKEIRGHSSVPVMMLTALKDTQHEVYGLERGADEYIGKPFSYEVFVARLNAMTRKIKTAQREVLRKGLLVIDQNTRTAQVDGVELTLNRKEFSLLVYFIKNYNQVLSRDQLLQGVWGYEFEGDERTVDTHIKMLRGKLGDCGCYIKTVRGSGYLFEVVE